MALSANTTFVSCVPPMPMAKVAFQGCAHVAITLGVLPLPLPALPLAVLELEGRQPQTRLPLRLPWLLV